MSENRLTAAIRLAPLAAALTPGALLLAGSLTTIRADEWLYLPGGILFFGFWSLVIGYPIALMHGLVGSWLYRWLSRYRPVRWWTAGAAGGAIGALPVTILQGANALIRDGWANPDAGGPELPLILGAAGVVGGLVFWWILRGGEREMMA
ncbi:hypothetical protein OF829_08645 [Sphingomonas sp. LB-2]|uniref:hypothetical protein n=1 Tax=Sphingomonas caeni TaxID=2984949 RepID=UPI00223050D2|nr:hypothetical protein [Sphingomonas caeni]MCW3847308.1 hypothetical protein [Sphingomonas caeni]